MELFSQIQTIAQKYGLEKFITKSQDIMSDIPLIQIGFLGEFSSGKSTLINAIVGEKVLPAMEKPTSKAIVHITPVTGYPEKKYYAASANADGWFEITSYDFSEIAMGNQHGGPLKVITDAKGILRDGYVFVDTPGISSLNESDYDITFGCLPFLDGIVLCVDIGKGSLTKSILEFLAKKEVRPLLDQIVVAINMADNKPVTRHSDIKSNIVEQIKEFCTNHEIPLSDVENRVAVVSAKNVLEGIDISAINSFMDVFKSVILSRYQKQLETRRLKLLFELSQNLLFLLKEMLINLRLDESEFEAKEKVLLKEKIDIGEHIKNINRNIERMRWNLEGQLVSLANNSIHVLVDASQKGNQSFTEALTFLIQKMNQEAEKIVSEHIKENLHIPKLSFDCHDIAFKIGKITNIRQMTKAFATAASVAALTVATAGVSGVAAAGAGAAGAAAGTAATTAGSLAKTTAKASLISNGTMKSTAAGFFLGVGKVLHDLNPFVLIGDIASKHFSYQALEKSLPEIARQSANNFFYMIKKEIEFTILEPLNERAEMTLAALKDCRNSKSEQKQVIEQQRKDIERDVSVLSS